MPRRTRAPWRARWQTGVDNWCLLVDRGELTTRSWVEVCRAAIAEAWRQRFERVPLARAVRAQALVPLAALCALVLMGLATRWFAYARAIPESGDRVVGHLLIFTLALGASVVLVLFRGAGLSGRGWRPRVFLALETPLLLIALTMLWVEGGAWIRTRLPLGVASAVIGGLLWSLLFLCAFIWTAGWCFTDQSRRCPVCLRRLTCPVSIGRWSSVFEPATTELVCEDGHGLLCFADREGDPSAAWTTLDTTWKGL